MEIIAQAISEALLPHAAFCEQVGERGQAWFKAHLNAENEAHETSHELITIRLAKIYAGSSVTEEQLADEVRKAIDLFIEAGDECHTHSCSVGGREWP